LGKIQNMKNHFWAGLGSRAVLVKKKGPIMSNFWKVFLRGEKSVFLELKISM
jgi:hypothetical protein